MSALNLFRPLGRLRFVSNAGIVSTPKRIWSMSTTKVLPPLGSPGVLSAPVKTSGTARSVRTRSDSRHIAITFEYVARVVMLGLLFITHTNSF
jgi:hypothetical protein